MQWTFYSATSFLEKSRKVVLEMWFFKLGFFFFFFTFLRPEKRWIYCIKLPFFWSTTFLKPDFSNQIFKPLFSTHFSRKVVAD